MKRSEAQVSPKKKTVGQALTEEMAEDQRRVVSEWRALLLIRRATQRIPAAERRWSVAPDSLEAVRTVLTRLARSGEFAHVKDAPFLFEAKTPFARGGALDEEEALMEVHPFAALSHLSALYFHQLTDEFPQEVHLVLPSGANGSMRPLGVLEEEWEVGVWGNLGRQPGLILGRQVHWHRLAYAPAEVGTAEFRPRGYPVRVTTPARTLLDGLMHPEWCGGVQKVMRAWGQSRDTLDVPALVELVDLMDKALLRQRAGFVLESLGLSHPALDAWAASAKRGGSSRLVGGEPFVPKFSERWKLSLNASTDVLREEL